MPLYPSVENYMNFLINQQDQVKQIWIGWKNSQWLRNHILESGDTAIDFSVSLPNVWLLLVEASYLLLALLRGRVLNTYISFRISGSAKQMDKFYLCYSLLFSNILFFIYSLPSWFCSVSSLLHQIHYICWYFWLWRIRSDYDMNASKVQLSS